MRFQSARVGNRPVTFLIGDDFANAEDAKQRLPIELEALTRCSGDEANLDPATYAGASASLVNDYAAREKASRS